LSRELQAAVDGWVLRLSAARNRSVSRAPSAGDIRPRLGEARRSSATGVTYRETRPNQVVDLETGGLGNGHGSPRGMWCQPARLRTHSSLLIGVLQIRRMTCGHPCRGHAQSRTRLQHGVDASNALSVLASGFGIIPASCAVCRQEREFLRARVIARSCGVAADGGHAARSRKMFGAIGPVGLGLVIVAAGLGALLSWMLASPRGRRIPGVRG